MSIGASTALLEKAAPPQLLEGLHLGADGSLTLCIQHAPPTTVDGRANWLPAPPDGFYLCLRAYLPRPELLDGRYRLPGLQARYPPA